MNESTPRLWFLPPLDTLGSFRVGFGVALGLLAVNLTAALILGGATSLGIRFAMFFPVSTGYVLAVALWCSPGCARRSTNWKESTDSERPARLLPRRPASRSR